MDDTLTWILVVGVVVLTALIALIAAGAAYNRRSERLHEQFGPGAP